MSKKFVFLALFLVLASFALAKINVSSSSGTVPSAPFPPAPTDSAAMPAYQQVESQAPVQSSKPTPVSSGTDLSFQNQQPAQPATPPATLGQMGTSNYLASAPAFSTCADISSLTLPTPSTGYYIHQGLDIDVQAGVVSYRILQNGDIIGSQKFNVQPCISYVPNPSSIATAPLDAKLAQVFGDLAALESAATATDTNNTASSTAQMVTFRGNSASLWYSKFWQKISEIYDGYQTFILIAYLFFVLAGTGFSFTSQKVQNLQANEDQIAKFAMGSFFIIFLFIGNSGFGTTRAHWLLGYAVDEGVSAANFISGAASYSNLQKISQTSLFAGDRAKIQAAASELDFTSQKESAYSKIINGCNNQYDTSYLQSIVSKTGQSGTQNVFPQSYNQAGVDSEYEFEYRFLNPSFQNLPHYSLATCASAESQYRALLVSKKQTQSIIDEASKINYRAAASKFANQMTKASKSNGWFGIALLPAQQALAKSQPSPLVSNRQQSAFDKVDFSDIANTYKNFDATRTAESIGQRAAYMFVPGASSIYQTTQSSLLAVTDAVTLPISTTLQATAAGTAQAGKSPIGGGIIGIAAKVVGLDVATAAGAAAGLEMLRVGKQLFVNFVSFYATTSLMEAIIDNLVYIVIIAVAAVAIVLYHAELLFFTIAMPFSVLVAFRNGQKEAFFSLLGRGLAIAMRPALIVLSVFVAVYAADLYSSIMSGLTSKETAMLYGHAKSTYEASPNLLSGFGDLIASYMGIAVLKGLLNIIAAIVSVYLMSKLIIQGPSILIESVGAKLSQSINSVSESAATQAGRHPVA